MDAANSIQWAYVAPGLVLGLFGWLCYRFGSVAVGAIVGAGTLGVLGYVLSGLFASPHAAALASGAGVVLGAVGGVMFMRALLNYLFFLAGASVGSAIGWRLATGGALAGVAPGASAGWGLALTLVAGALLGGFLMLHFRRFVIAVLTSVGGAGLVYTGLPAAWQARNWPLPALLLVFLVVQAGLVRRFVDRETFDRHSMHPRYRHEATAVRDKR